MKKGHWEKNLVELIRRTSCDLPPDIEAALRKAARREKKGTHASAVLDTMLDNVAMAREKSVPMCQDTGTLTFYFSVPSGYDTNALASMTRRAVSRATRLGYLRVNTVDAVAGGVYVTNVAHYAPVLYFQQCARKTIDVRLLMKGGGCENVGAQYKLPDTSLDAGRDLDGVRRCLLDSVWRAQGRGCSPGVLGVCIGGDRATGFAHAKEQFLRRLDDSAPVRELARLEDQVMKDVRRLEIGPMGLGGKTTLMGVKIGAVARLPASFFVTIAYMCWAYRRRGVVLGPEGGVQRWTY